MSLFRKQTQQSSGDFDYLSPNDCYLDTACQSLRPQCVIDAEMEYYQRYNACGGRVKYEWGETVDKKVEDTREQVLAYLGKSSRDYVVAFTLNTTYGVNLILNQLETAPYSRIVTSDIEHNSVFLPTIALRKRSGLERIVLPRTDDGSIVYKREQLKKSIAIFNAVSNIDGRVLSNIKDLASDIHAQGGVLCVDAAQAMVSQRATLSELDFDCLFGSSHKMYGPSLGFIVIKKTLLEQCAFNFIGGGMVSDVLNDSYTLIADETQRASRLEPGLQDWAAIIGFSQALIWLTKEDRYAESVRLASLLRNELKTIPEIVLTNESPSSIVTWYANGIDSHAIALMYSKNNIMVRSGYFCCHYYLQQVKNIPPLVRMSFGAHNTDTDIQTIIAATKTIFTILK